MFPQAPLKPLLGGRRLNVSRKLKRRFDKHCPGRKLTTGSGGLSRPSTEHPSNLNPFSSGGALVLLSLGGRKNSGGSLSDKQSMSVLFPDPKSLIAPVPSVNAAFPNNLPQNPSTISPRGRVLVIDDSLMTLKVLVRRLGNAGLIVETAPNGYFGLSKMQNSLYDCV